ncbi:autophagy-related protein 11 isoform X3 [Rosa chinensis]|uniref:autophagy-related protein 11 isoform X3 n=1 Tax=Rosa chinensis TaxID=74649 RepID=UPI000D08B1E4|nr:autophagy-related protein 11 isoform X3 [Rosa chinensis]
MRQAWELDTNRKLLDESQMNCAQTHLFAADRRASEYSALRASAVKMRGLFERLRSCVNAQGMTGFVESLRSLAQSLGKWSTLACFHWLRILRKHRSL